MTEAWLSVVWVGHRGVEHDTDRAARERRLDGRAEIDVDQHVIEIVVASAAEQLVLEPDREPRMVGLQARDDVAEPVGIERIVVGRARRRIAGEEDIARDRLAICGQQRVPVVGETEAVGKIAAIQPEAVGDQEQTELLSRVQLARIIKIAERHRIACREGAAARAK